MSPVFAHGSLRLYLLSLLDESPKHGYELIQALTDRSGGTYSPSAGTIYPRLAKLEEEGLVTKTSDGRKTVYEITEAGRAELAARAGELDGIEDQLTDSVRRIADEVRSGVTAAMKSLRADLASAAREAKQSAKPGPSWTSTAEESADQKVQGRLALHETDVSINEFRQAVRAELREHVARGGALDDDTVSALRADLVAVRDRLRERLSGS
ncbi:helix-turn-helix transcriptional regulator [Plantibacter sp. VKM Ac-2885]|uniref:Transcriptional regulator, PadR family n=1 Tax=Plantibacter elymi (nom. nud.) TaxID=199708 RepID=A0ABY1RH87_9MICO|nr:MULTISPECIES: PadR family transcriptional regulator [unclassified Plantibacter]MBD8517118.1 helix-turn-helix transcriptional regulator [Plantibacter sp. CFBP 8804]MBD8537104.1 helix-turn-helix transcriptional regulator [Plantibacter sp. CFBP 13570]MBF4511930.1 helix-turn-helix transcriptional regulator [Plantibacter sp. VKM Ac-2885]SMQ72720.1 transcriptional regulator, PadR family [Plantibacter sp. VKM Ac-1784]